MSAPDTNIKKQEKNHKGPLSGMALVIGFVVLITIAFSLWLAFNGNEPGNDVPVGAEQAADGVATDPAAVGSDAELPATAPEATGTTAQ